MKASVVTVLIVIPPLSNQIPYHIRFLYLVSLSFFSICSYEALSREMYPSLWVRVRGERVNSITEFVT